MLRFISVFTLGIVVACLTTGRVDAKEPHEEFWQFLKGDWNFKGNAGGKRMPFSMSGRCVRKPSNMARSTRQEFEEFRDEMVGTWKGAITMTTDIEGIGKMGDKLTVTVVNTQTEDGKSILGKGAVDVGSGSATTLIYFDVKTNQIKRLTIFDQGTQWVTPKTTICESVLTPA